MLVVDVMQSITKKQAFDYERIAMAQHEASHAVCALYNFLQVYDVRVMTPNHSEGNADFYIYSSDNEEISNIFNIFELQAIYAGLIGEKIYYKDISGSSKFPMHLRIGSSVDIALASKLIRKNNLATPGKNTMSLKKRLHKEVEEILIEHWDAVKAVAHALYKKNRLSFKDLKFILTRRTNHQEFWKDRFNKINLLYKKPLYDIEVLKIISKNTII